MDGSKQLPSLRGAAAAMVLLGAGLLLLAGLLPGQPPDVAEPPGWLGATWVVLPGLLMVVGGLAARAAYDPNQRTAGFRFWCGALAVAAIGPAAWSVGYAGAALHSWVPVRAPSLFAVGFVAVLVGAATLTATGPAVRAESQWNGHRLLLGAAAGVLLVGAAVAAWIVVQPVDATTAERVDRPAAPANPETESWAWEPPDGERVLDVVTAGAGIVARTSDGIIALDGRTGEERWHYRRSGRRGDSGHGTYTPPSTC